MIVGFTGHRPDKLGGWDPMHPVVVRVRYELCDWLKVNRPLYAISGMALGVDQWAADACVQLGIPFVAALPCDGMADKWPPLSRQRWEQLLKKAHEIVVVCPGPYKPWKMQRRNEYIVDHCSKLLAVHDGSAGGTFNCIRYAEEVKREVVRLAWQNT